MIYIQLVLFHFYGNMIKVSKSFYGANWVNIRNKPFRIIENNISIRRHYSVLTDSFYQGGE